MPGRLVNAFAETINEKKRVGRNEIEGDEKPNYFPRSALQQYWTEEKLKETFLQSDPVIIQKPKEIAEHYLLTFSILVHIGKPEAIEQFTQYERDDQHLPLIAKPHEWPENIFYDELFDRFFENQWPFCPRQFRDGSMHKRKLHPRVILPVKYEKCLSQSSTDVAAVWKVEIDDEYIDHTEIPSNIVAFKVYQDEESENLFTSEADAYNSFPEESEQYIVNCYGTFQQGQKRTLILEYTPNGSLLDFFKRTSLPTRNDLDKLWTALFDMLQALHTIHEMNKPKDVDSQKWVLSSTHHDVQPVNILVFQKDPNLPFNIRFKLADFGSSHIRKKIAGRRHSSAEPRYGNRMYIAPESCRLYDVQDPLPNGVEPTVDVWSLGAVFSEILVWSILGEKGRESYRLQRLEETSEHKSMRGSGYDGSFHNGDSRLNAVDAMHEQALSEARRMDDISPVISEVILDCMLLKKVRGRLDPIQVLWQFQDRIKNRPRSSNRRILLDETPVGRREPHVRDTRRHTYHNLATSESEHREPEEVNGSESRPAKFKNFNSDSAVLRIHPNGVKRPESTYKTTTGNYERSSSTSHTTSDYDQTTLENRRANGNSSQDSSDVLHESPSESESLGNRAEPGTKNTNTGNTLSRQPLPSLLHHTSLNMKNTNPRGSLDPQQQVAESMPDERNVTIAKVYKLIEKKDGLFGFLGQKTKAKKKLLDLPGISKALAKIRAVGGREQIFLVDDFESMKPFKEQVQKAIRVISYYVKDVDPNSAELYYTSELHAPIRCSESSVFETSVKNHTFKPGECPMQHSLNNILDYIMNSSGYRQKYVSLYVFTDGVWEAGASQADAFIARAAKQLIDNKALKQKVMIQFIRFGDSPPGIERLRHLDDDIVEDFGLTEDSDIVDTKSYKDSVPNILVGSICSTIDQRKATMRVELPHTAKETMVSGRNLWGTKRTA